MHDRWPFRNAENFQDLAQLQIEYFRKLIEFLKDNHEDNHAVSVSTTESFFGLALDSYYDSVVSPLGLASVAGHVIFRLSDFVDEKERRSIVLYPSQRGSVIDNGELCDTLEDWREHWIQHHPDGIPTLTELWPEASKYLPIFQNPQE